MESELLLSQIVYEAFIIVLLFSAIPLGSSLFVGLLVSVFQAATQISEQTLSFVPKLLAVIGSIAICGSWLLDMIRQFAIKALESAAIFHLS